MNKKDDKILNELKKNSRLTTSQISKKTNIPITTVHNRILKLKDDVINKFTVEINYEKLGLPLLAYVLVSAFNILRSGKGISQEEIAKKIKKYDLVDSVEIITGDFDLLVKIRASSMESLNSTITQYIRHVEGVDKTKTMMVMKEI